MKKLWFYSFLLALALGFGASANVSAQGPDPQQQQLYTKLYCPLCGGVRLDTCELKVCDDMKKVIAERKAKGESDEQIIAYFRTQFGDQVLGYPPPEGIHWAAWLAPAALVVLGAFFLWRMASRWTRQPAAIRRANVPPTSSENSDVIARIERELLE